MARGVSIRESIDAEKRLFTDPEFQDIQESLARGGRVRGEDIPLSMQEALGVKDYQKLKLTRKGYENFIQDRNDSWDSPEGWKPDRDAIRISLLAGDALNRSRNGSSRSIPNWVSPEVALDARANILANFQKKFGRKPTANEMVELDKVVGLPKQTTPLVSDTPSEKIDNVGGIDWNNIFNTLLNKQTNKGRPIARKLATSTPGPIGDVMTLLQGTQDSKDAGANPLAQYLMSLKRVAGDVASKVAGVPISKEAQALEALNKLMPGGIYQSKKGLKKWAGIGRFETPYGRMYIDESGTLTKEPTEHAPALRSL